MIFHGLLSKALRVEGRLGANGAFGEAWEALVSQLLMEKNQRLDHYPPQTPNDVRFFLGSQDTFFLGWSPLGSFGGKTEQLRSSSYFLSG